MNFDKKICIAGAGGFGREVLCCLIDCVASSNKNIRDIACFMVDDKYYSSSKMMGIDVIRKSDFDPASFDVVAAIGDSVLRKKMVDSLPVETTYATIIHPTVIKSAWVEIGEGSIVTAGTILTCNIKIGKHAHLNLHTTVGHDCVIGNFFTAAPAVNISGNCEIGDCVYFGTNAAVTQKTTICSNVVIGMGAVVLKNIVEEGVYVGNPVRKLEKK